MPQPPTEPIVLGALRYAEKVYGPRIADEVAQGLAADWTAAEAEGPHAQGMHAAAWQLLRAARHRAAGNVALAALHDRIAEACVLGWRDELTVRTAADGIEDTATGNG